MEGKKKMGGSVETKTDTEYQIGDAAIYRRFYARNAAWKEACARNVEWFSSQ
jgi:hypothetical protein